MKRLALACSVVVVTFLLGIVAVSVAQRDARNRESVPIVRPDYAMQSPEPFRASIAGEDESIESDSSAPPLDVPPPLSRNLIVRGNDEEVNTESPVVLASDNQLIAPPSLTPTPSLWIQSAAVGEQSAAPKLCRREQLSDSNEQLTGQQLTGHQPTENRCAYREFIAAE